MANSAMTHLPQLKSICRDVIELILLLLLYCILHMTPQFIGLNFDWKYLFGRAANYPAGQRDDSFRHRKSELISDSDRERVNWRARPIYPPKFRFKLRPSACISHPPPVIASFRK